MISIKVKLTPGLIFREIFVLDIFCICKKLRWMETLNMDNYC